MTTRYDPQTRLMTSRYRVEYHLKSHRRDEFIEWIKGLLVVPFVLVRDVPSKSDFESENNENAVKNRYACVFSDVEGLIEDHSFPFYESIDHSRSSARKYAAPL